MRLPQDPRDGAWRLAGQAPSAPRGVPGGRSPGPAPAAASPGTGVSAGTPASPPPAAGAEFAIYPLSLRLTGRRVVVVGGGSVALRRVTGLRTAGADILVVSPQLSPTLGDLAGRGLITARTRGYEPADLDGAWLVFACTDQPGVNAAVAADAEQQRIWCVRADDAAASAAWVPATGRSGPVTVAVNAGRNPRRAAALRDRFVATVDTEGRLAEKAGELQDGEPRSPGRVSIVGGGPGDPGLITVTGLRRLREADVVVADRLAPLQLLDELPPDTQVIDAAKVPGGPAMRQDHINHALVEHARAGRAVVRLKGGDPFVFGRGREEVEACLTAGVPVEVVPGVTSAVSVPAAAGIPVTHRGVSQGFCVLAGHVRPGDSRSSVDWVALARSGMTLVLLMAIDHLAEIADTLISAGLGGGTPGAVVSDGWSRQQRVVTAPLRDLAGAVRTAGVTNPAVVVIGDVADLAATGLLLPAAPPAPGSPPPGGAPLPTAPVSVHAPAPPPIAAVSMESAAPSPATARPGRRVLVLGGARSGKSATAEGMLAGNGPVDYVVTGAPPGSGDAEWDARVAEHRRRRPPHWRTVETLALAEVLAAPDSAPVLVDCLTTWLARVMDDCAAWDDAEGSAWVLADRIEQVLHAWRHTRRQVIAVSNEIGSGVVPDTASGRRFRAELGQLNARIAADC